MQIPGVVGYVIRIHALASVPDRNEESVCLLSVWHVLFLFIYKLASGSVVPERRRAARL